MKVLSSSLFLSIALASISSSASSSRQALIRTIDVDVDGSSTEPSPSNNRRSAEISPTVAQLIIDRRLGTNIRDKIGEDVTEAIIQRLDRFGGTQRPMFADDDAKETMKVGVLIEGWDFNDQQGEAKLGTELSCLDQRAIESLTNTATDAEKVRPSSLWVSDLGKVDLWENLMSDSPRRESCSFSKQSKSGLKVDIQLRDKVNIYVMRLRYSVADLASQTELQPTGQW